MDADKHGKGTNWRWVWPIYAFGDGGVILYSMGETPMLRVGLLSQLGDDLVRHRELFAEFGDFSADFGQRL